MALQIIARGEVCKNLLDKHYPLLITDDDRGWVLGGWATKYIGQTLIISVEEPEEELEPIINKRLKELVWPTRA